MARKPAWPANQPTREQLESVVGAAQVLTWHIRRYWSIDGAPLPEPRVGTVGNNHAFRRAADLLTSVEAQRRGTYPGAVIEWQLQELVFEWQSVNAGQLVFSPNVLAPWITNPPAEVVERSVVPLDAWTGWAEHVPFALRAVVLAAAKIVNPISRDGVPSSFVGSDLDQLDTATGRLREAIAFIPSDLQELILAALDGKAMTRDELCWALRNGERPISTETLYGKRGRGGLNELIEVGLVQNNRQIGGYFRPHAPPTQKSEQKANSL